MLYQWVLCTTMPQWIRHTEPHVHTECDHLNQCAAQSTEYHDHWGCHKRTPFFASQTISVLNDARSLWLPATIICKVNNGSYLVQVIGDEQRFCKTRNIQHWHCSTSCISISSCQPGSETSNSHCTHNTNTSFTSSYTANSMWSSTCSTFTTMNTDAIHWSPSEPDWHIPCCPTLINLKQEATIQTSWRDIDLDYPSQMNLMMPWPRMPPAHLLMCCTLN